MKQRILGERYGPLTFERDFSLKVHPGIVSQLSTTSPTIIDNNYIPVFPQQQR